MPTFEATLDESKSAAHFLRFLDCVTCVVVVEEG